MDATQELPAVSPHAAAPPVLGRYRLGARLGSGGFGTVYAAHDERLDRPVAVKVIPAHGPAPERGTREALAAARLDHPGIVAVYDAGEDDAARYLVSELVRGRTLDRLAADGALSDRDVLRVGLSLADALAHAHGRGVIHRDVKPQNVIVPDKPRSARSAAKLTDFGVAHLAGDEPLTRTGDVVGTLAYMAPEQAAGQRVDERADLYSLALVLYEGLAGMNPVRAGSPAATARRVGTVLPALQRARKDLPAELCAAIDRALRPRPDERGTLDDLAGALAGGLPAVSDDGGTILAHPLERAGRPVLPPVAARAGAALGAGALVALAAAVAGDPGVLGGLGGGAEADPAAAAASPGSPLGVLGSGAAAALAVALLPRAGWLAAAVTAVLLLAPVRPGLALLVAAAAVAPPLLARRAGLGWSLPAAAPLLGLASVAGAYPALAGRAVRATHRAALGAAGAWWLLLAEPDAPPGWALDAGRALHDVLAPLATSEALVLAPLWAAAALVLPWLVRGRRLAPDVVGAIAWAAGLGTATEAIAEWAGSGQAHGATAGAVAAAALAVCVPRVLPRDTVQG